MSRHCLDEIYHHLPIFWGHRRCCVAKKFTIFDLFSHFTSQISIKFSFFDVYNTSAPPTLCFSVLEVM